MMFTGDDRVGAFHKNGTPWYEAPVPKKGIFRKHRCEAQTSGWNDYFFRTDRCACGAIRRDNGVWKNKFSR